MLAALGALVWSVQSSEPPASSKPVAADPPGAAPSSPVPSPPSLATGAPRAPRPVAPGSPVEPVPQAPGSGPTVQAVSPTAPADDRERDPFGAIEPEPRDEAFAGPRETALLGIVQGRLEARELTDVAIERAECFTSTCVMELGIPGDSEQVRLAVEAIQSGPLADSVTLEGTAPTGSRTRIRLRVFYGPDSRDHESFLSRIGGAEAP